MAAITTAITYKIKQKRLNRNITFRQQCFMFVDVAIRLEDKQQPSYSQLFAAVKFKLMFSACLH